MRFPSKPASFVPELHGIYDVRQDGFSFGGHIFAFFSTDHFTDGKVMGRSVLARCDQPVPAIETSDPRYPLTFQYLTEFSRYRFINVSVQYASAANRPPVATYRMDEKACLSGEQGPIAWITSAFHCWRWTMRRSGANC